MLRFICAGMKEVIGMPKSAGVLKAGMKRGLMPRFVAMWVLLTMLGIDDVGVAEHDGMDVVRLAGGAAGEQRVGRVVEQRRVVVREHVAREHAVLGVDGVVDLDRESDTGC